MATLLPLAAREKIYSDWLAALRSGKYKQAKYALNRSEAHPEHSSHQAGMCCLGVLCDVSGVGEWQDQANAEEKERIYVVPNTSGKPIDWTTQDRVRSDTMLPYELADMIGMDRSGDYEFTCEKEGWTDTAALYNHNDEDELNFGQIADIIEKNKRAIFHKWPEHKND